MFEMSQLRCFIAVGEELHFGRAAERLNMTQPPLSRQIRLLEHQVGTPLFERTNRVVRFTAAGKTFLPQAVRILHLAASTGESAVEAVLAVLLEGGELQDFAQVRMALRPVCPEPPLCQIDPPDLRVYDECIAAAGGGL